MTPEERIAQLEDEVRSLRMVNEAQAIALRAANLRLQDEGEAAKALRERREAARLKKQRQRALRAAGLEVSRDSGADVSPGLSRDNDGTTPSPSSPLPSSFPPSSKPSSPYPLSFPPSSPPPSASQEPLPVPGGKPFALERPARPKSRATREKPPDPRHAPLVKTLTEIGFPFNGGRDAKNVTALLALADQRETTHGELAGMEVVRRARIGWAWAGFPACKSLSELVSHWGHYEKPQGQPVGAPAAPKASDPGWVTV